MTDKGCKAVDGIDRRVEGFAACTPSHRFETNVNGHIPNSYHLKRVLQRCHCCRAPDGLHLIEASSSTLRIDSTNGFFAHDRAGVLPIPGTSSFKPPPDSTSERMVVCPAAAIDLGICGLDCMALFNQLAEDSIEFEFTIYSIGICSIQNDLIQQLDGASVFLKCIGNAAVLYVYLDMVLRTAVMYEQGRLTLYMIGAGDQILFSVRVWLNERSETEFYSTIKF